MIRIIYFNTFNSVFKINIIKPVVDISGYIKIKYYWSYNKKASSFAIPPNHKLILKINYTYP